MIKLFKIFEELQSTILYHGTNEDITENDIQPDKRLKGIYTTTARSAAKDYGDNILCFKLKNNAKILDLSDGYDLYNWMVKQSIIEDEELEDSDLENYILSGRLFQYDWQSKTHKCDFVVSHAKNEGYDVVKVPDDLRGKVDNIAWIIINKNVLIPNSTIQENFSPFTIKKWYHFSDVDYVKLKPQPSHSDPAGIYMFPDYALDELKAYWKKKKYRFTINLKPNLNILDLDELTKKQELEIIRKLNTQNDEQLKKFMKYFNTEEETYYNFWQYIRAIYDRTVYGRENSNVSRSEFMKLGYDGIFSKKIIHSYEPQIIIFDEKNINIIKVEERDDIYSPNLYIRKIKEFIYRTLKEDELKWNEYTDEYRNNPSYSITVKKGDKSFGIKIHYTGNDDGTIHVNISPYKSRGYSMGGLINIYEPDWEDFGKQVTVDLLKTIEDLETD